MSSPDIDLVRTMEVLDSKGEGRDMVVARLLDSADRLNDPQHRGNQFPWPENAQMLRDLARSLAAAPDPQPPAAPETDVRLTEAERTDIAVAVHDTDAAGCSCESAYAAIERIVAERVRVVEGERDALAAAYATAPSCEAQGTCRALPAEQQWIKAMGERDVLAKAMWDARALFGFDTDGDKRYHSTDYLAIARSFIRDMAEIRTEINDRIEEVVIEEDLAAAATARAESAEAAHEALRAGVEALADEWDACDEHGNPLREGSLGEAADELRALANGSAS